MEDASEIKYQAKPTIKRDKLPYLKPGEKEIYVNLFKIKINKPLKLFQYPYSVSPDIDAADLRIRNKLFKYAGIGTKKDRKRLKDFYGECFISGDSLYGMNEVKESKTFNCKLYLDGETEYTITIQPKANQRTINQNDLEKDPLTKQFIEILIQDILRANPNLDFYRGLFVLKNQKKVIYSENNGSVNFYPGYTTSFMETESGNYLNVTLKNKILSTDTVLDFMEYYEYKKKKNQAQIKKKLIGRSFKVSYAKKNYIIDDISFDRDPKSHNFMHDGKTKTLEEYYKEKYKINIKDLTQPLIVVKKKDAQGKDFNLYFVPEMCYLAGLDDEFLKDREFMKNLANYTKLDPKFRITKTNEFLKLLVETKNKEIKRDGKVIKELSSKEKSELYGIEISALDQLHKAYNMKETELLAGKKKAITAKDKIFDVISKKDMSHWICLYRKSNYNDAEKLYNTLDKASQGYDLSIAEPEWVEMGDNDNEEEWAQTANDYMKKISEKDKNVKKYSFALFLLDRNDRIYSTLKYYSLCEHGYISQVVKASSLYTKNALSVCSKILLQINAKLSGVSYIAKFDKNIKERNLMIIGVDSSHIRGKRTGVAMVATINPSFTNFYNKEQIILEEKKESFLISISSFIEEAIQKYNEINKTYPKGIIIYRQGVSFQQKEFLKNEVINIQKVCDKNKLLYEYILVNTKTTYKFFEKDKGGYKNPDGGLLVLSGVTNRDLFEFYIQPQQVTGGSATPSCFTVAYGNMDFPEIIPKLTFDFCHLYSNWQGTVRVPHVLKLAEKLSKMTAKYTEAELHKNLSINQAYL
jgi:aubergine-like protein